MAGALSGDRTASARRDSIPDIAGGRGWWTCTRGEESEVSSVLTPLSTFRERFGASRLLIGVLHVGALRGTPRACDSIGMLIRRTADEAQVYRDAGFPAVVIENMHDRPYLEGRVRPLVASLLAAIGSEG